MFHHTDANVLSQGMTDERNVCWHADAILDNYSLSRYGIRSYHGKARKWQQTIYILHCIYRMNTCLLRVATGPKLAIGTAL
jgi:hypothetical protein